jgi:hypothetical protein
MRREPIQVTIVTANAETFDGLQAYLSLRGLAARNAGQLGELDAKSCSAVIFFPDEFLLKDVLHELRRLRQGQPRVLVLVVTREPERYVEVVNAEGIGRAPVVIPKPVWGWTILDAIRAGLKSLSGRAADP